MGVEVGSQAEMGGQAIASAKPQQLEGQRCVLNGGIQDYLEALAHLLHVLILPLGHLGSARL